MMSWNFSPRVSASVEGEAAVSFPEGAAELLKSAAKAIADRAPLHDVEVVGVIKNISVVEPQERFEVRLVALFDGQARSLSGVFDRTDWDLLQMAFADDRPVMFLADLEAEGRGFRAVNIMDLQVQSS